MIKKLFLLILVTLGIVASVEGQDPVYSQFYAAPMQLSPALTGIVAAPVFSLNYRNQWPNIPNAYSTFSASYSQYIPRMNSGIGVRVEGDIAGGGIYNSIRAGLFYAYDIRFTEDFFVRVGLEGSVVNQRLQWNRLVFLDQLDLATGAQNGQGGMNPTNEQQGVPSRTFFDMSAGFLVNTKYFYAGLALKHMTAPRESYVGGTQDGSEQLPMAISVHAGSEFRISKRNKIGTKAFLSPSLLFLKQQKYYQLNAGAYLRYGIILGGIWFRHNFTNSDAVIVMVGIQKGFFKVAYSYDITVSQLGMQTGGAHEISLLFNFEKQFSNSADRYNDCLGLFR